MQIIINFDDIGWLEECGVGEAVDEHFKSEVIRGLQDRLTDKLYASMLKEVESKKNDLVSQLDEKASEITSDFLTELTKKKIDTLKIPKKKSTYSSDVEYLSVTEYIGERYERFLTEKSLDEDGNYTQYDHKKKYSATEYLFDKAFGEELKKKIAATIAEARKKAETEIIGSLENTLQEHLTADIIKKINVPEMLKRLQEKYGKLPEIKDK